MEQLAPGASDPQPVAAMKFVVRVDGAPMNTAWAPVFCTEMTCVGPALPAPFANVRASGEMAMPGSAVPVPVNEAEATPTEVLMLSEPLLGPVALGANCSHIEQEAA
jgi:hypothetical protein